METCQVELLERLCAARGVPFARQPHRHRVQGAGVEISCLDWGGDGPTAIFLHGGSLSARTFNMVCAGLADRLRCVAVDLRGHGRSGWSEDYRVAASVADMVALADHLAAGPVHLVGMSLGGCIAGHAAAALGERTASLTFVDVGAEVDFAASAGVRDFMDNIRPVARIEDLVAKALSVSPRTDPDLLLYRYRALLKPSPGGFVLRQDRRRTPDFPHILAEIARLADVAPDIARPVLVVRGGRSRILTDETAARFAGRFPKGRWVVVPDAGHNVQEDKPADLVAALSDHILDPRRLPCA